ncbi:hypothetical protein [Jiangella muralis]|uniref:hypothetical protein n=1 Tax=Jiangella muralis TaxID=702383 RepID=UPI00069F332F|nr:hypothetical protein [Jiangella muralis]
MTRLVTSAARAGRRGGAAGPGRRRLGWPGGAPASSASAVPNSAQPRGRGRRRSHVLTSAPARQSAEIADARRWSELAYRADRRSDLYG